MVTQVNLLLLAREAVGWLVFLPTSGSHFHLVLDSAFTRLMKNTRSNEVFAFLMSPVLEYQSSSVQAVQHCYNTTASPRVAQTGGSLPRTQL